jgi:hypothetical protein
MHCILKVVSKFNDLGLMHAFDWANNIFLPMVACRGCILAKIQHPSLFSFNIVPHKQNA